MRNVSSRITPTERSRRDFLQRSLGALGSASLAMTLQMYLGRTALGQSPTSPGYGPLRPAKDETTGLELLKLPEGFRYVSYGWAGDAMTGGVVTPGGHDGMAVIATSGSTVTLCRNHELETWDKPFGSDALRYDENAGGGCSNLVFDTAAGRWSESWPSLAGTVRNCAGGSTPWNTWLSCEETTLGPGDKALKQTHGWVFEVAAKEGRPVPLKAMGRLRHEAVAVDPATGYVYETEDNEPKAGFYRFVPQEASRLSAGGELYMLKVAGATDLRSGSGIGQVYAVSWVPIEEPERAHRDLAKADSQGVFSQGEAQGGAAFARLEGCWYGNGLIYINSTSGGALGLGQVWQYDPKNEQLKLIFESPSKDVLYRPDNIAVSPRGGLVLCEDGDVVPQRLMGMTADGRIFAFAENNIVLNGERNGLQGDHRKEEWCGATFSGEWLFVNNQTPGITFAITGPWAQGVL